ncbi:MAG: dTDP-4-dehydrorhamnose reductase [Coriobacteriia bacterium]
MSSKIAPRATADLAPHATADLAPHRANRFLIAGAGGMLGTALQRVLTARGLEFVAPREGEFDITNRPLVLDAVEAFASGGGGVLLNAAAYTDVERAEDERDRAFLVNETGAGLLAAAARDAGLGFVHVSTDFVFDGAKRGAYVEDDAPHPMSVYGQSKLAGERAVAAESPDALIVRTAWVFGPNGRNFPGKILELARSRPRLKVVTDEVGSPTYTMDLAAGLLDLLAAGATGVVHLANAGSCTRFEMAAEILRIAGIQRELVPVSSAEFPTRAERPRNSVLDCSRAATFGVVMPEWHDALARYLRRDDK